MFNINNISRVKYQNSGNVPPQADFYPVFQDAAYSTNYSGDYFFPGNMKNFYYGPHVSDVQKAFLEYQKGNMSNDPELAKFKLVGGADGRLGDYTSTAIQKWGKPMIDWMYAQGKMTPQQVALYKQLGYDKPAQVPVTNTNPKEAYDDAAWQEYYNSKQAVNRDPQNNTVIADPTQPVSNDQMQSWTVSHTNGKWISNPGSRLSYQTSQRFGNVPAFNTGSGNSNTSQIGTTTSNPSYNNINYDRRIPKWMQKVGNGVKGLFKRDINPEYIKERESLLNPLKDNISQTRQIMRDENYHDATMRKKARLQKRDTRLHERLRTDLAENEALNKLQDARTFGAQSHIRANQEVARANQATRLQNAYDNQIQRNINRTQRDVNRVNNVGGYGFAEGGPVIPKFQGTDPLTANKYTPDNYISQSQQGMFSTPGSFSTFMTPSYKLKDTYSDSDMFDITMKNGNKNYDQTFRGFNPEPTLSLNNRQLPASLRFNTNNPSDVLGNPNYNPSITGIGDQTNVNGTDDNDGNNTRGKGNNNGLLDRGARWQLAGSFLPAIYNAATYFGGYRQALPKYNRYRYQVLHNMQQRQAPEDLSKVAAMYKMNDANMREGSPNAQVENANRLALYGQMSDKMREAQLQNFMMNQDFAAKADQTMYQIGAEEAQAEENARLENLQHEAARDNFMHTAMSQFGAGMVNYGDKLQSRDENELEWNIIGQIQKNYGLPAYEAYVNGEVDLEDLVQFRGNVQAAKNAKQQRQQQTSTSTNTQDLSTNGLNASSTTTTTKTN